MSEEGLVIGSGEGCALSLPPESALKESHVQIKWIPGVFGLVGYLVVSLCCVKWVGLRIDLAT